MGTWDLKEPQCPPLGNSLEVLQTQSCPKEFVMVVPVMIIGLSKLKYRIRLQLVIPHHLIAHWEL